MMTLSALNQFLKQHTTEETQRLNGVKKDYSQFPVARGKFDTPCYRFDTNLEDLRSLFLSKKVLPSYYNFAVVKQDRFENVPLHIHEWMELSYIYSGSCTMTINKTTFRLKAGQMVLISQNAPHSVKRCSENDIIINFLLTREYLNGTFFERLSQDNYLTHFFIEALNTTMQESMYIVFSPEQKQNRLADLANQFLCEFYSPSVTSGPFLDSLFTLITCEMINLFQHGMVLDHASVDQIYTILRYIETNFADCTLSSTAEFFNMHPNYLSAYIRQHTGTTYKELVQTHRLSQAAKLLRSTALSTNDISLAVGYQNTSFFFQLFRKKYGCTPMEYRNMLHASDTPNM